MQTKYKPQYNRQHDEWVRENEKHYSIKFNLKSDADIIERLEAERSTGIRNYLRRLIREDIEKDIEKEEKNMKHFIIDPEHYDDFGSTYNDCIVTDEQIADFSRDWEKPLDEILDMVEEIKLDAPRLIHIVRDIRSNDEFDAYFWTEADARKSLAGQLDNLTNAEIGRAKFMYEVRIVDCADDVPAEQAAREDDDLMLYDSRIVYQEEA